MKFIHGIGSPYQGWAPDRLRLEPPQISSSEERVHTSYLYSSWESQSIMNYLGSALYSQALGRLPGA